eukprot:11813552-Karenia_brevis.AAC.1
MWVPFLIGEVPTVDKYHSSQIIMMTCNNNANLNSTASLANSGAGLMNALGSIDAVTGAVPLGSYSNRCTSPAIKVCRRSGATCRSVRRVSNG